MKSALPTVKRGAPAHGAITAHRVQLRLPAAHIAFAKKLGDGNVSEGVRRALEAAQSARIARERAKP